MNICEKRKSDKILSFFITLILLAFLGLVFYINLSCNPQYYNGDIYCDINYARTAWEAKSVFPSNWVFGNQFYIFATPNLASLFYGITYNAILAMAIASCIMSVFLLLAYNYMTKVVFSYNARMIGFLAMAALMLNYLNRANFYFTMANYYSCYLIVAFITYGCYLRIKKEKLVRKDIPMIIASIVLSFAMGMQSLRQTAIMIIPLFLVEIFFIIISLKINKKVFVSKSTVFAFAILIANIIGLIVVNFMNVTQVVSSDIDAAFSLNFSNIIERIYNEFYFCFLPSINIIESHSYVFVGVIIAVYILGFILGLRELIKSRLEKYDYFIITLLFLFGILTVFAVGIFTKIESASRYYIMVYPLLAVSLAYIMSYFKKVKTPILVALILFFGIFISNKSICFFNEIQEDKNQNNSSYKAAEYILNNDYETVCSVYFVDKKGCRAESIVVSSNYKINKVVYFYDETRNKWFTPLKTLCIIDEYKNIDNSKCIYCLSEKNLNQAIKAASEYGINLEPVAKFDEIVLCKASDNLLVAAYESNNK